LNDVGGVGGTTGTLAQAAARSAPAIAIGIRIGIVHGVRFRDFRNM
jgi:hypothetical protein